MPSSEDPPTLSYETLVLLRRVLFAQQLSVGDEGFRSTAQRVLTALDELDHVMSAHAEAELPSANSATVSP